jgi:glycyl-tRNA synthetase beta chain
MPEFFLELFSEEIPAGMQAGAASQLEAICTTALQPLRINLVKTFAGPRRIALRAILDQETSARVVEERGPREAAPEAALAGFLGKHKASREDVVVEDGYFWLRRNEPAIAALDLIQNSLPAALAKFSWPKSMRWGQGGDFSWVRPLRRMICLYDGAVIPIKLGPVTAGNETEGHRVLAPGAFKIFSAADWETKLRDRFVFANESVRGQNIQTDLEHLAASRQLTLVADAGLMNEVNGLVEWPVGLIGQIDAQFMDLPPEVRELSMKVNQKYFALRDAKGNPAPYFAFVANLEAPDGGAAIIAGNERVLRARLSDARHFWDLDLKTPLSDLLPKLAKISFHAKIGTQLERSEGIAKRAREIAEILGADAVQAGWAGRLCKADLVTGMVGEFPELQGIMGGYYAAKNPRGWDGAIVGPAISTHYQPKGPSDAVPGGLVAVSVALADKLDTLVQFFRVGEKPTGSGDPYALRRAALGVIRIILENNLRLPLKPLLGGDGSLFDFIIERLRVKLRGEGKRFDVLDAVLAAGSDDDLVRLMKRVDALGAMLATEDGKNLLAAYKRASNILKIEDAKDGPHTSEFVLESLPIQLTAEADLRDLLVVVERETTAYFATEDYKRAMLIFAALRATIDAFFQNVTVNADENDIRRNRLKLLARFRDTVHQIADFSKIEG